MPSGRPSSYTKEVGDEICDRLMQGETLRSICRDERMPASMTVRNWALNSPIFMTQYARARDLGIDEQAEKALEIAQDGSQDYIDGEDGRRVVDHECVQRSRLIIDTIKWYVGKVAPKRYGDRVMLTGSQEDPITIRVQDLENEG